MESSRERDIAVLIKQFNEKKEKLSEDAGELFRSFYDDYFNHVCRKTSAQAKVEAPYQYGTYYTRRKGAPTPSFDPGGRSH